MPAGALSLASWSSRAENLAAALTRLKRLVMTVDRAQGDRPETRRASRTRVARARSIEAVSDDLNTPRALPSLDELLADKKLSPADRLAALAEFDAVLGLDLPTLTREDLRVRPADAAITAERDRSAASPSAAKRAPRRISPAPTRSATNSPPPASR